jgi:hypothetical protein
VDCKHTHQEYYEYLTHPLALALLAVYTQFAAAQDAPLRQIGTVIIEGSRPTSLPTQIPTTFEGISHADIERCINATDAEDALKYMPSLLVRKRYRRLQPRRAVHPRLRHGQQRPFHGV